MRQQLVDVTRPLRRQASENVFQTSIRIMPIHARRLDQTGFNGHVMGALLTSTYLDPSLDGFVAVIEAVHNSVLGLAGRALAGPHIYEQIPELAKSSH
jgi:hypothetical protein